MSNIKLFESKQVRTEWDSKTQKWYFAIVAVVAVLTESVDPCAYWRKLKERLKKEGNETVSNCHGLKMTAADGKQRLTDVAKARDKNFWSVRVSSDLRLSTTLGDEVMKIFRV